MEAVSTTNIYLSCQPDNNVAGASDDPVIYDVSAKETGMDDEKPKEDPYEVNLNRFLQMLGEELTPFKQAATENVNHRLIEKEMDGEEC